MSAKQPVRISAVSWKGGHRLLVRWIGGGRSSVDLAKLVRGIKGLRPLRQLQRFARVVVGDGGHSVAWPGDIDVGADRLWELALEQSGREGAVEFLRWRWRHGLNVDQAASALGLARRTRASYVNGTRPLPRTVLLACKGWEREARDNAAA